MRQAPKIPNLKANVRVSAQPGKASGSDLGFQRLLLGDGLRFAHDGALQRLLQRPQLFVRL
jgi:hypothetical protein